MIYTTVAKIYAEAVFMIASETKKISEYRESLKNINDIFAAQEELAVIFISPAIPKQVKNKIIDEVFKDEEPLVLNFLHILIDKHREKILNAVISEYAKLIDRREELVRVEVLSAQGLSYEHKKAITDLLTRGLGRKVELEERVTPGIIGGIVLKTEEAVIDGSLKKYLEQFKEQLIK